MGRGTLLLAFLASFASGCGDDEAQEASASDAKSDDKDEKKEKKADEKAKAEQKQPEPDKPPEEPPPEEPPPEEPPAEEPPPESDEVVEEGLGAAVGSKAEAELIDGAIRARRIRALDIMLVDGRRSKRMRFEKAEAWCAKREIEGVRGWRLPTIGEVSSLTLSAMTRRDNYWSSTKGDTFGDRMLVWNGKRKKIRSTSKRWRGARGICVRTRDGRPPDDQDMEVQIDE